MSNKRFGTIETIQLIFQYPDTFFDLIRLMDARTEISIPEYELIHRVEKASRRAHDKDRKRLKIAFRTENLVGSGLVSIDKKGGTPHLYFERALIDLLRVCDRSLRQDLTNSRLKSELSSLRELKRQVIESQLLESSLEFQEASQEMSSQMNSVIRLIHGNVRDLELDVSKRMEDISKEIALSENLSISRHYELLSGITTINERHIIPTLEFLNPSIKLSDGENLFETLEGLGEKYREHGFWELADQIDRSLISLNETYKPIQIISNRVNDFVVKNQMALREHNAMENAFEKLRGLLSDTQSSHMNRTLMKGDEFVEETGFVSGLVTKNLPNITELHDNRSTIRLFFSDIKSRAEDVERVVEAPVLGDSTASRSSSGIDMDRTTKLYKWLQGMTFPETPDIMSHLHQRLDTFVEGYNSVSDLMDALGYLTHSKQLTGRIRTTNRFAVLDDGDQQLIYRLRRVKADPKLKKDEEHV